MTVWNDFYKTYRAPNVEGITVGFSGIDPSPICGGNGGLTQEEVNNLIADYISKVKIRIDGGEFDPDSGDLNIPYIDLPPGEIPHNDLKGLQGGQDGEYYHLKAEELLNLGKLITELIPDGTVSIDHEQLSNLLGGDAAGHYHLTEDELDKLLQLIALTFPAGSSTPVLPS